VACGVLRLIAQANNSGVNTMPYQIEVTDTFGGEANYCWVKRERVEDVPAARPGDNAGQDQQRARRYLVRRAKAFAGWTGMRCETYDSGDLIEIRPRGLNQICFVTWED